MTTASRHATKNPALNTRTALAARRLAEDLVRSLGGRLVAADRVLIAAVAAGCSGLLTEDQAAQEVVDTIRAAAAGESLISPAQLARIAEVTPPAADTVRDATAGPAPDRSGAGPAVRRSGAAVYRL